MKRYYRKTIRRLLSAETTPDAQREAERQAGEVAQVLTRLRHNPTGNVLERALFHVLDDALKKQAARLARERSQAKRKARKGGEG